VPYRGGDVKLEAGLFSVKEADLAAPFLEVLDDLSSAAGTSVIGALPFAGPLVKAFDMLVAAPDAVQLEIGVSNTMPAGDLRAGGTFVVMRAPVGTVNGARLAKLVEDEVNAIVGAPASIRTPKARASKARAITPLEDVPLFVMGDSAIGE
jgi:hypothetical protein